MELEDTIEVSDPENRFSPDRATVVSIGARKINVEFEQVGVKNEWVNPTDCDLIARR